MPPTPKRGRRKLGVEKGFHENKAGNVIANRGRRGDEGNLPAGMIASGSAPSAAPPMGMEGQNPGQYYPNATANAYSDKSMNKWLDKAYQSVMGGMMGPPQLGVLHGPGTTGGSSPELLEYLKGNPEYAMQVRSWLAAQPKGQVQAGAGGLQTQLFEQFPELKGAYLSGSENWSQNPGTGEMVEPLYTPPTQTPTVPETPVPQRVGRRMRFPRAYQPMAGDTQGYRPGMAKLLQQLGRGQY